jgi:hypothetical protein
MLTTAPNMVLWNLGFLKYSLLRIASIKLENIQNKFRINVLLSMYFLHLLSVRIPNRIPSLGCVH